MVITHLMYYLHSCVLKLTSKYLFINRNCLRTEVHYVMSQSLHFIINFMLIKCRQIPCQ